MGVNLNRWGQVLILSALITGSAGTIVVAEEVDRAVGRLDAPTIPDVVERNTELDSFWDYATTIGDTKFLFNIDRPEQEITTAGFRTEVLFKDLLQQQDDNNPTVRTPDMPSPFSTSVFQLRTLSGQ